MSNGDFEQFRQLCEVWLDMAGKMGGLFNQPKIGQPPTEAGRQLRGAVFKTMSEQVEDYLKSETFLEGMKAAMDSGLKFQKQYQGALAEFRHATEGVAATDVDAMIRAVHQVETRILDRLDNIERRLEEMQQRVDGRANEAAGAGERRSS